MGVPGVFLLHVPGPHATAAGWEGHICSIMCKKRISGSYHVEKPEGDIICQGLPHSNGTPSRWLGTTCGEGAQPA